MAQPISTILPALLNQEQTASETRSIVALDLDNLPARLSDEQFTQVVAIAEGELPPAEKASDEYILRCLKTMQAVLPRQKTDAVSGELAVETYLRFLRGCPKAQIAHMAKQAVDTLEWFPTIAKCNELMKGWARVDAAVHRQVKALAIAHDERLARKEDFFANLAAGKIAQEKIDALPEGIIWEGRKREILKWDGERFIVKKSDKG